MKYFVWVQGLKGPEPQIWDEENKTLNGKPIKALMGPIEISDATNLETARIMHPYPFEVKP